MAIIDIEYGKEIIAELSSEEISEKKKKEVLELEMVLQNSSYGHEYALLELEQTQDFLQQEELIGKIDNYKRAYFLARRYLKKENPIRLEKIESELMDQKVKIFGTYTAWCFTKDELQNMKAPPNIRGGRLFLWPSFSTAKIQY